MKSSILSTYVADVSSPGRLQSMILNDWSTPKHRVNTILSCLARNIPILYIIHIDIVIRLAGASFRDPPISCVYSAIMAVWLEDDLAASLHRFITRLCDRTDRVTSVYLCIDAGVSVMKPDVSAEESLQCFIALAMRLAEVLFLWDNGLIRESCVCAVHNCDLVAEPSF